MSVEDEELRAREHLAALQRRERARQALLRALGGDPQARRELAAKYAALRGVNGGPAQR